MKPISFKRKIATLLITAAILIFLASVVTIQQWLLQQGIAESRITIKGWGGKRMIYEEDDPRAFLNVRVEVEVLEEGK